MYTANATVGIPTGSAPGGSDVGGSQGRTPEAANMVAGDPTALSSQTPPASTPLSTSVAPLICPAPFPQPQFAAPLAPMPLPHRLFPQPYPLPVQFAHPQQVNWKAVAAAAAPGAIIPQVQMASAYRIGRYTPAERKVRLDRYRAKRAQRNYNRRVKYDCRKMIADKRHRVQGRFVKREEEIAIAAKKALQASTSNALGVLPGDGQDEREGDHALPHASDDIGDLSAEYSHGSASNSSAPTRTLLDSRDVPQSPRSHDEEEPVSPNAHFFAAAANLPSLHDDDKLGEIKSGSFA